jgi:hypothetical protein
MAAALEQGRQTRLRTARRRSGGDEREFLATARPPAKQLQQQFRLPSKLPNLGEVIEL